MKLGHRNDNNNKFNDNSTSYKEDVFIIDLLELNKNKNYMLELNNILEKIFLNKDIIKFGQSILNDFHELNQSYTYMTCFNEIYSIIDTHQLIKFIDKSNFNQISLKNLIKKYLNLNLIKIYQLSDWSIRPLSKEQLHYAACDSLVLLRLYDKLIYEIELNLNLINNDNIELNKMILKESKTHHTKISSLSSSSSFKSSSSSSKSTTFHSSSLILQHNNSSIYKNWQSQSYKLWLQQQQHLSGQQQQLSGQQQQLKKVPLQFRTSQSLVEAPSSLVALSPLQSTISTTSKIINIMNTTTTNNTYTSTTTVTSLTTNKNKNKKRKRSLSQDIHIPLPLGTGRHVKYSND